MSDYSLHVPVPAAELDPHGELRPSAFIRLLQTAASEASHALGYTAEWYERNGTTWVVRRTHFEQGEPARLGDRLRIRTWVSDMRRVRSWRRYEVSRASDGAAIASAATDWVYATAAGAPAPVPPDLQRHFMPDGVVTEARPSRITMPAGADSPAIRLRAVEWADLDSLGHVNNARYADFVEHAVIAHLESRGWRQTPTSAANGHLRPISLELEYLRPLLYAEPVAAAVALASPGDDTLRAVVELSSAGIPVLAARVSHRWTGASLPAALVAAATGAAAGAD